MQDPGSQARHGISGNHNERSAAKKFRYFEYMLAVSLSLLCLHLHLFCHRLSISRPSLVIVPLRDSGIDGMISSSRSLL